MHKYARYNKERSERLRKEGRCLCCAKEPVAIGRGNKPVRYCFMCRERVFEDMKSIRAVIKTEVLSHYGKQSKLQCCWPGCEVLDPDMLTIDHIDNSGAEARRKDKNNGGATLYARLKRQSYPDGFQTLCHNHQWKKELMRRRDK